jgi:hypothetical protein
MNVSQLGVIFCTGNSGNHTVVLQDMNYTVLATATINMNGGVVGQFCYGDITPLVLAGGSSYILRKQITSGGQNWAGDGPMTINDGSGYLCYGGLTDHTGGAVGYMFGGVDLTYETVPIPPGTVPVTFHGSQSLSLGTAPTGVWFNVPIGTPKPNRRVLICLDYCYSGGNPATNITIGGIAATRIVVFTGTHGGVGSFSGDLVWAYADVPTGTNADVDFDEGAIDGGGYITIVTYSFDKSLAAAAPVFSSYDIAAVTSLTLSVNTVAGGFCIVGGLWDLFTDMTTGVPSITSASETYTRGHSSIRSGTSQKNQYYHANNVGTLTPSNATLSWTVACPGVLCMLTWPPAGTVEREVTPLAATADLKVRLFCASTQIAEWTHLDVAETFKDAEQTLTAPQVAAITNFANLIAEFDDNKGNVYRFAIGDPPSVLSAPIKVKYRYKKLTA